MPAQGSAEALHPLEPGGDRSFRQQKKELLAAQTTDDIAGAQPFGEECARLGEHGIPGGVAERV
ncbi:MAG TPA: hypothetical protein VIC32_08480, partial [Terriglobales bacterium]